MIGKNKTNEGHTRDLQVKSDMYTKKYKHKTRTSKANNINSHNGTPTVRPCVHRKG